MNEPRESLRMEKLQEIPVLLDVYGCLLTEKQRQALSLCYESDCSLGEIAARHGSSRQAAYNLIERGEAQLRAYEASLHVIAASQARAALLEQLAQFARTANIDSRDRQRLQALLDELAGCC